MNFQDRGLISLPPAHADGRSGLGLDQRPVLLAEESDVFSLQLNAQSGESGLLEESLDLGLHLLHCGPGSDQHDPVVLSQERHCRGGVSEHLVLHVETEASRGGGGLSFALRPPSRREQFGDDGLFPWNLLESLFTLKVLQESYSLLDVLSPSSHDNLRLLCRGLLDRHHRVGALFDLPHRGALLREQSPGNWGTHGDVLVARLIVNLQLHELQGRLHLRLRTVEGHLVRVCCHKDPKVGFDLLHVAAPLPNNRRGSLAVHRDGRLSRKVQLPQVRHSSTRIAVKACDDQRAVRLPLHCSGSCCGRLFDHHTQLPLQPASSALELRQHARDLRTQVDGDRLRLYFPGEVIHLQTLHLCHSPQHPHTLLPLLRLLHLPRVLLHSCLDLSFQFCDVLLELLERLQLQADRHLGPLVAQVLCSLLLSEIGVGGGLQIPDVLNQGLGSQIFVVRLLHLRGMVLSERLESPHDAVHRSLLLPKVLQHLPWCHFGQGGNGAEGLLRSSQRLLPLLVEGIVPDVVLLNFFQVLQSPLFSDLSSLPLLLLSCLVLQTSSRILIQPRRNAILRPVIVVIAVDVSVDPRVVVGGFGVIGDRGLGGGFGGRRLSLDGLG
mmetsp:Transcript_26381/g.51853  ORF Transcript_26381/g.51853 Transcript_26381/m.51853 type:complete len:608 (-) Transcript_26381:66-1889(-)